MPPIYEYVCRKCQGAVELTRTVADYRAAFECPKCQGYNSGPVEPQIHAVHGRVWGGTPVFYDGGRKR